MSEAARPTSIRKVILFLIVLVAILLYLDRYCLGFVLTYIKEQYGLTENETRFLLGAFFYTYAFGQLPCGWLADRYGVRLMLSLYLATWSALTGLMGFAHGFVMLLFFRFGCGLFEAGAYPACAGLIRRWIPYEQRGLASGIVSFGGRIGGTVAPPATAYLMLLLFLPLSQSSLVEPDDLLHPHKLAQDMLSQNDPKLPARVQQAVAHLQKRLSPQVRQVFETWSEPERQRGAPTDLATAVNELLKQPDLAQGIDLQALRSRLNRQARELFEPTESPRSEEEITRRNRFLLEVLFPESIRKLEGNSWQPVLLIYGMIGVLIAMVFWLFYRNTPREHFLCNEAEAQLVEAHEKGREEPAPPLSDVIYGILASPGLWASGVVQFGTNFVWIFLGNELPTFLQRVYQVPIETRGWMTFWPFFLGVPMLLLGGWWTDWMTQRYGRRLGRSFPLASTRFLGAAAMLTCCFLDAPWPITIALCVFSMASDAGIPAIWAYNLDVGGRNVGLILGWGNMIGNLGAAMSAQILGYILKLYVDVDHSYSLDDLKRGYSAVFLTCAAVYVFIGVLSFFVDATKPIGVGNSSTKDTKEHEE